MGSVTFKASGSLRVRGKGLTQRDAGKEDPIFDQLYPVGCIALVRERVATDIHTFIVVEGLRWASLEALDPPDGGSVTAR